MFYGHKLVNKELKSSRTAMDVIYQKMLNNDGNVDKKIRGLALIAAE